METPLDINKSTTAPVKQFIYCICNKIAEVKYERNIVLMIIYIRTENVTP